MHKAVQTQIYIASWIHAQGCTDTNVSEVEWSRTDEHADVGAFTLRNTTVHTERGALAH